MLRHVAKRAFSRPALRSFASQIREPGPVGLSAGDNPRETLLDLYNKTFDALKEIPEEAAYRTNVEKITKYRMGVVKDNDGIEEIEAKLNIGQIAEVIEQAEDELQLIPQMAEWKPWETADGQKPAVIQVVD